MSRPHKSNLRVVEQVEAIEDRDLDRQERVLRILVETLHAPNSATQRAGRFLSRVFRTMMDTAFVFVGLALFSLVMLGVLGGLFALIGGAAYAVPVALLIGIVVFAAWHKNADK